MELLVSDLIKNKRVAILEGDMWLHDLSEKFYDHFRGIKGPQKNGNVVPLINLYDQPERINLLYDLQVDVIVLQTTGLNPSFDNLSKRFVNLLKKGYKPESVIILLGEDKVIPLLKAFPHIKGYSVVDDFNWAVEELEV